MTVDLDPLRRAATVRSYDVLGQPERPDLSAVADLAARICGVSHAAVNLITDTEQHHAATSGMAPLVCTVEESMCAAVLDEAPPVVVPDCRRHPVLCGNSFVDGRLGSVRFYASWRLVSRAGVAFGTLCVFDDEVHELDAEQLDALGTLADRVVDILELALRSRELSATLEEVLAVRAELERSNERLASFAGQVSHDLKTPLTSITLSLSLIREELAAEPAVVETLPLIDRAVGASNRMAALVDDVLAFATLGDPDPDREEVDLGEVVRHVRADLWELLADVELTTDELPVVCGHPAQLRALLQNLVDNAAKYADPDRPPAIHVGARRLAAGWRIEVTDNGRGVPAGLRERVFEPLARAEVDRPGTGIGLATCRRVVEAHGGRIGLLPVATGGTTAWFELPD